MATPTQTPEPSGVKSPQGSVLGPTLWNVLFDGIFSVALPEQTCLFGYADDIAVMVEGDNLDRLTDGANDALRALVEWLEDRHLELAPEKSEAVMVKGPKNVPIRAHIEIKGRMIDIKKTVKYLGVIIDWQGYFGPHVRYVCHKASDRAASLSRLLPNIGGPSCEKRRIVMAVIHSIILYAAPIWAGATAIKCYKNLLESTQRKGLLRVCCAYRTASTAAVQVITGVPPYGPAGYGTRKTIQRSGKPRRVIQ
ncbi:hypothetical protein NQ315_003255 [Exocentrus adspersus]|uniref:Reverse transcriptase domain-containing protein n=1 Tax=Exocentrus adspersus TaxID=1586481 RepID=A0AAV8VDA0_9CUCU|nr:hypothetical protein NQ315_003255 [Exocentrus adspersus]